MEFIDFGDHKIIIKRRPRRKGLRLAVFPSGEIVLSTGSTTRTAVLKDFVHHRRQWLVKALADALNLRAKYPPKKFRNGEIFPFLGEDFTLQMQRGAPLDLRFSGRQIHFCRPPEMSDRQCVALLKECYFAAGTRIVGESVKRWSQEMGLFPRTVQYRRQKSIWGSCSADNSISLNLKLIVAPRWVIDYVVIHELAHIRHKNHARQFWQLVAQFTAHQEPAKIWLRENQYKSDFLNRRSELWINGEEDQQFVRK